MRTAPLALALLLQASVASSAFPSPTAPPAAAAAAARTPSPPRARSRLLPTAAAVVPGLVVHGTGHYALGEPKTGRNLLLMQGIGLGIFLAGGLTIVFTGASRYFVAPAATATIAGFGLFSTSYLADIYGTVSTDSGAVRHAYRLPTTWETEMGYRRIQDPEFAYRDFLVERVSRRIGPLSLSPSGFFSTRGDTARYRIEAQYRLVDDTPDDIRFVDLTFGLTHQRYRPEHFTRSGAELSLDTRYDLARLGPTLRGSFIELGAGYALARLDYNLSGVKVPRDLDHVLLGRIGFGVMLRGQSAPGSEALVYYDHRHDDYVAGLKLHGIGSGVIGHFGLATRWFFNDSVGVALDAQAGSAYLAGASLIVRSHEYLPMCGRPCAVLRRKEEAAR